MDDFKKICNDNILVLLHELAINKTVSPRIFTVTWDVQSSDNLDVNQKILLCIKCFILCVEHLVEFHWLYDIFLDVGGTVLHNV